MPANYGFIRTENRRKYGEEIARIGGMLLADRYDDRTHFIFEVLQNAEDALMKRGEWHGTRAVEFSLSSNALEISHFGKPFDEADVRGVCGIGESTKELTDIGRFGIGFKSVYAFTDNPEIHSGQENFAIDSYVWPKAAKERCLGPEETQIYIPFRADEPSANEEVLKGLRRLSLRTLLFLREIEEISWSVVDGPSGLYLRNDPEVIGNGARRVVLIGQDDARDDVEEEWIVFSRQVFNEEISAGYVEVAFVLNRDIASSNDVSVGSVTDSQLVVFFPTVLSAHLGFVVQGPYRTTPSRDNVPQEDPWNQHLVQETAVLLVDALRELRELGLLDVSAMQCLPLSASSFAEGSRFAPLFRAVREALQTEALLPAYNGGHIAAQNAKLARTQDLRDLIGSEQLASLFLSNDNPTWLSREITADRTHVLHDYLASELGIGEVTPEWLVSRLTAGFLETQPDEWIEQLYVFLSGRRALLPRLRAMPLVRLESRSHTVAFDSHGKPQAYLPGNTPTGFPTVRRSVCKPDEAQAFLESLGLRVPDPVDDVIANVLPKFRSQVDIPDDEYQSDIRRVLAAFDTDSAAQRRNLLSEIRKVKIVAAVDTRSGINQFVRPGEAYLATERLKSLFEGVPGVFLVDDSKDCLKGERIRELLRTAGTSEYLVPTPVEPSLNNEDKRELRRIYGDVEITNEVSVEDYTLRGLDSCIAVLATMPGEQASRRAELLWDALRDVQQRRANSFYGRYKWFRYGERSEYFKARFIRTLNEVTWVPDKGDMLQPPSAVVFEDTGWEEDRSLATIISFKPGALNELSKETGIELGALDLLKKLGYTSEAELRKQLGIEDDSESVSDDSPEDKNGVLPGDEPEATVPEPDRRDTTSGIEYVNKDAEGAAPGNGGVQGSKPSGQRKFNTYVAVDSNEVTEDRYRLSHRERMDLEDQAISLILSKEPTLQRTPPNNAGFDLEETGPEGDTVRWVEVKAMKGTFDDHPVGVTSTQFRFAQERQDAYWLYVVERAGDPEQSRIVRIKNPAGKAQTFTFDRGWIEVSEDVE